MMQTNLDLIEEQTFHLWQFHCLFCYISIRPHKQKGGIGVTIFAQAYIRNEQAVRQCLKAMHAQGEKLCILDNLLGDMWRKYGYRVSPGERE